MKQIAFGKTGAQVSELCLGTMYFGTMVDVETSEAILETYVNAGGTFLDTANKYACWIEGFTGGESETLLGKWMKDRGNRQDLFLATKVGLPMPGVQKGLRSHQIIEECNKSLKRLETDVIDLYYAHADDRDTPLEESLGAFDTLVKSGKVRFVGASNYFAWRLKQAQVISDQKQLVSFSCVQMKYSYIQPRLGVPQEFAAQMPATEELFDFCGEHGLTMLAYSPLMAGVFNRDDKSLSAAYDNDDNRLRIEKVRTLAARLGKTPNQIVIAWLMHHSNPSIIPVIGVSTVDQLLENIQSLNIQLSEEDIEMLTIK